VGGDEFYVLRCDTNGDGGGEFGVRFEGTVGGVEEGGVSERGVFILENLPNGAASLSAGIVGL
jgi:hypothetical protein